MTLVHYALMASLGLNFISFLSIAFLLDKKAASHDDNWPMGV